MLKRISLILVLIAICLPFCVFAQDNPLQVIKIPFENKSEEALKSLFRMGLDITSINREQKHIDVLVKNDEIEKIQKLGFDYDVIIADAGEFVCQLRQTGYLDNFHSYEQILQELNEAANQYPQLVKLEDIGDSYEKTIGLEGHDIWAMKISDNVQVEEDEPEVFFMANLHAREIITPEIIMYFMHYLLDNYGTDGYVTRLVNTRQIWLIPTSNPDGLAYVFSGTSCQNRNDPMLWRKNKRDNNNNGQFDPEYDGVDLNRNFGYAWGIDDAGSSPNPSSNTYRGSAPFSEPEAQVIRDFVNQHNFIVSLSFHSYSQLWLYPWGFKYDHAPDHDIFLALADSCVAYNNYTAQSGADLYLVNGDTDDWLYGEQTEKNKIFAFTPEVGSSAEAIAGCWGFYPDPGNIQKQILENQGPMLYMTYAAGEEPFIEHTPLPDTELSGPYPVTVQIKPPIVLTTAATIDSDNVFLYFNDTGTAPFDSVQMMATGNPNEFAGDIPDLGAGKNIYYYIAAADKNGRTGYFPRSAPLSGKSFYVGMDMEPPVITHVPLSAASIYSEKILIKATATDNGEVSSVKLHYRKNTNPLDSLDMLTTGIPDEYQAEITTENLSSVDYYDYSIIARDNSANKNTVRIPEQGFFRINIKNSIFYDFETEAIFSAQSGGDWQWGVPAFGPESAHSGTKIWATNLSGNYSDLTESILETPEISLADKDSAKLTFWHWYINEYSGGTYWDGANVKISVDGAPFQIIEPEGGYDGVIDDYNTFLGGQPCFGGPSSTGNFWHPELFDLSAYKDQTIKLRFHFASDGAVSTDGWYIDDVEIQFMELTSVKREQIKLSNMPQEFSLGQNFPNPFNPSTEIKYALAKDCDVSLKIFNMMGQTIKTLVNQKQTAGFYSVLWNGKTDLNQHVSSGLYFYQLIIKADGLERIYHKKMIKLE